MTDYLVDSSVWVRLASGDSIVGLRYDASSAPPADLFVTCPPQVLEFCHSARTLWSTHATESRSPSGSRWSTRPTSPWSSMSRARNSGLDRSAGAVDILIAVYAIVNDATVLTAHYD